MRTMEFLLVVHDTDRDVLIDGVPAGITNHLITLAPGAYTVSLDGNADFRPPELEILVVGTSPLKPMKVLFV